MTLWRTVGRAGEAAYLHLDGLEWDDEFQCAMMQVAQTKVSKLKVAPMGAGIDRHSCWLVCLSDFLALQVPSGPRTRVISRMDLP